MNRESFLIKTVSVLLIFTFVSSQAFALGPSIVSGDMLKERSDKVKTDMAGKVEPSAIGEKTSLLGLLKGEIPPQSPLTAEAVERLQKAAELALKISLDSNNMAKVPPEHINKAKGVASNLVSLCSNFSRRVHPYDFGFKEHDDYLAGFRATIYPNEVPSAGLAIDFIDWLYSKYPPEIAERRVAQYVYHESVPEKLVIMEDGESIDRSDHKATYKVLQTIFFGAEETAALGKDIREYIDLKAIEKNWPNPANLPPEKRVVMLISGGECAGVNAYFALLAQKLARYGYSLELVRFGFNNLVLDADNFARNRVWVDPQLARKILNMPGAAVGTARVKLDNKDHPEYLPNAVNNIKGYCKTIVVVGGNDHLGEASKLARELQKEEAGVAVIALPKTIDRDTKIYPIGAETAGRYARDFTLRAASLPKSNSCTVIEMMGRDMGWLAVTAANMKLNDFSGYTPEEIKKMQEIAPTLVVAIPEYSVNKDNRTIVSLSDIVDAVRARMEKYGAATVVISEGFRLSEKDPLLNEILQKNPVLRARFLQVGKDSQGNLLFNELGISDFISEAISMKVPGLSRGENLTREIFGYSIRTRELPAGSTDAVVAEEATDKAAMLITDPDGRANVLARGGVCVSANIGLKNADDAKFTMQVRDLSEVIGKVDLIDSGLFSTDKLRRLNVLGVAGPTDNLTDMPKAAEGLIQPLGSNLGLVIDAVNAMSKAAKDMSRVNLCVMFGSDADKNIVYLSDPSRVPISISDEYSIEETRRGLIAISAVNGPISLTVLLRNAYETYGREKFLNIVLSGNVSIKKDDEILNLLKNDEALNKLIENAVKDADENPVFGERIIDLISMSLTSDMVLKKLGITSKKMSGIRRNILNGSISLLPGEKNVIQLPATVRNLSIKEKDYSIFRGIAAQNVGELLDNIKDAVRVTEDSVRVTNRAMFISEVVDYLAFEAGLSKVSDVKAAAQYIIQEAASSFNLKLASIHDFYMAKQQGRWSNITVPAVNGRTDVYHQYQQLFRAAREMNVGVLILELARSEMRYSAQDAAEFNAVSLAAAIKQGYKGLIFAQGDHYQVNKDKYQDEASREKELRAIEKLIRESVLAGKYNIDLDPSTLVDEAVLEQILGFEKELVDKYLESKDNFELLINLDDDGKKSLRRRLVDEIEMAEGEVDSLSPSEKKEIKDLYYRIEDLYVEMHKTNAQVAMRFIRYIRNLEKELGLAKPISIGIEERHIDNPKHKNNPSTVLGSATLIQTILAACHAEGLVGPSKLSLQTGTMHGIGGQVDFGIYKRHLQYRKKIGVAVFVQHGASTLEKHDFDKMKEGDVGEVHLATEYQKKALGMVARLLPQLGEEMARYLEGLMANDGKMRSKFGPMWNLAFGNPETAIAAIAAGDTSAAEKSDKYRALAQQLKKTRPQIITEILGDNMPKGLKGTLKDLTKELPGPFKEKLWNLPPEVRAAVDKDIYEEFATILEKLGVANSKALIEEIEPFNEQPTIARARPEAFNKAVEEASRVRLPEDIDAAIARVKFFTEGLTYVAIKKPEKALDLDNVVVIMRKDLPVAVTGAKSPVLDKALQDRYQIMKQQLKKLFTGEEGVVEVESAEELLKTAQELIAKGLKVIVLDDGKLTQGMSQTDMPGKAGENYCVITSDIVKDADILTIPFLNLNAMAMIGVGVLYNNVTIFEAAYKIFSGKEAPSKYINSLKEKTLWLIEVLPRMIKLIDAIRDKRKLEELFAVAA